MPISRALGQVRTRCGLYNSSTSVLSLDPPDVGTFLHFSDEGSQSWRDSCLSTVTLPVSGRAKMQTKVCPAPKPVPSPKAMLPPSDRSQLHTFMALVYSPKHGVSNAWGSPWGAQLHTAAPALPACCPYLGSAPAGPGSSRSP